MVTQTPDAGVGHRLGVGLALDRCLDLDEVGHGAAWDLDLLVGVNGAVIDARVRGAPRGVRCLTDRVRSIRFSRANQPRHVAARVVADAGVSAAKKNRPTP